MEIKAWEYSLRDGPIQGSDDACNQPPGFDVAQMVIKEQRMQLETIIEAYEEFSEFDTAEPTD